jgi:hypothetical protein
MQIANESYTTLEQLSADPDLLAVMGSWRDMLAYSRDGDQSFQTMVITNSR